MRLVTMEDLRAVLAVEQEQEPVAWLTRRTRDAFISDGYETCAAKDYGAFPVFARPAPAQTPAEKARGYANLGVGAYRIDHSAAGNDAELVITLATAHDIANRTVGDTLDNEPDGQIEAKDMVIRIGFANEAGLSVLETQLRMLREAHFPDDGDITGKAGLLPEHGWDTPAQAPMSEEELERLAVGDEFLLYCSQDDFNEIARAVERYHGIGVKK